MPIGLYLIHLLILSGLPRLKYPFALSAFDLFRHSFYVLIYEYLLRFSNLHRSEFWGESKLDSPSSALLI
jgi:hypothetical protein